MSLTETTILFQFHTLCVNSLVFCQIIVTLFTICTCQCDFYSHNFHLRHIKMCFLFYANVSVNEKFAHKKKASTCVARSRITESLEKVKYSSYVFLCFLTFSHTGRIRRGKMHCTNLIKPQYKHPSLS